MVRYLYVQDREQFSYPEEVYKHWVVLAAEAGRFSYGVQGQQGSAGFGQLVFCPPGVPLGRMIESRLTFHFMEFDWMTEVGEGMEPSNAYYPEPIVTIRDIHRLKSNYDYMCPWSDTNEPGGRPLLNHLLTDLLYLYRSELEAYRQSVRTRTDPLMGQAALYLQQHAFGPLSMRELSDELGISQSQLTRRYQASFGRSPIEELTSTRLQAARTLLLETDRTLEDIAEACGYQNGYYLSRVFTKKMKVSPSEFRRAHRV
ncbi:hypothetical protein SY83_09975 [Paenibacillus swuensis]|uniref:HTH araC/xylS-type domain-containing protein n=2 Tax=Paenibacillus swuensis TaxID=1178515 RepID=A0A172TPC7_9BACL|nr:hypothetical protein SY83_09975 [Paenibacillus swuensis]